MGLVDLWTEKPDWSVFWFNNWISHQDIVQAIGKQKSIPLTMYAIDPWVQDAAEDILARHQEFHDDMNLALGIGGQDLSELDFNDPAAVQAWVYQNFMEHQAAHAALRL